MAIFAEAIGSIAQRIAEWDADRAERVQSVAGALLDVAEQRSEASSAGALQVGAARALEQVATLERIRAEASRLQSLVNGKDARISELEGECAELRGDVSALESLAATETERCRSAESQLANALARIGALTDELEKQVAMLTRTLRERDDARRSCESLRGAGKVAAVAGCLVLAVALSACGQTPVALPPSHLEVTATPTASGVQLEAVCLCPRPAECAPVDAGECPAPKCLATEADLNHAAGANEPACSGPNPDGGAGYVWGYKCGTVDESRWLLNAGCVLEVLR